MKILSKTGQSNLKKLNEQFERVVCIMSKTLRFNTINSTLREVNTEYTNKSPSKSTANKILDNYGINFFKRMLNDLNFF